MFYTLLKFLGWGALLAFIGGCIGWALRSLKCRGEVARARASTVDDEEVERMRHRLANLEQVVAERDRLSIQLADVRHSDSPGIVGGEIPDAIGATDPADGETAAAASATGDGVENGQPAADDVPDGVPDDADASSSDAAADGAAADGDASNLSIVPEIEQDDSAPDSQIIAGFADPLGSDDSDRSETDVPAEVTLDLGAAAGAIGKKIKLDDLTVVEGIGPKISELCRGIGVATWQQLADTELTVLQSMLDAAGSRYTVHKPGSWPQQAALLASGQWDAFVSFTDELDGGK